MANFENECAIIVLTRGYEKIDDYKVLIERNNHIRKNLRNVDIPLIFFHEGNITPEHQEHIIANTPDLWMNFIDISATAFLKDKESIKFDERTDHPPWQIGYRHMCHFWFKDFFDYVENYDYVLRIDEDCFVKFSIDKAFEEIISNKENPFFYGTTFGEPGWIVKNMNATTLDFMKKKGLNAKSRRAVGPLTCIFGLNLPIIREKMDILNEFFDHIDKSEGIYQYRWGDLPLWGEMMFYFFDIECLTEKYIKRWMLWYHKSHGKTVNLKYHQPEKKT